MKIKIRYIVYSNNGIIGECPRFVFMCAKLWHFLTRYNGLREVGSYVR